MARYADSHELLSLRSYNDEATNNLALKAHLSKRHTTSSSAREKLCTCYMPTPLSFLPPPRSSRCSF